MHSSKLKHVYKNKLYEACFADDTANSDNSDLAKRIISDNVLNSKSYEIAVNARYDGYQRRLEWCISFLKRKKYQEWEQV